MPGDKRPERRSAQEGRGPSLLARLTSLNGGVAPRSTDEVVELCEQVTRGSQPGPSRETEALDNGGKRKGKDRAASGDGESFRDRLAQVNGGVAPRTIDEVMELCEKVTGGSLPRPSQENASIDDQGKGKEKRRAVEGYETSFRNRTARVNGDVMPQSLDEVVELCRRVVVGQTPESNSEGGRRPGPEGYERGKVAGGDHGSGRYSSESSKLEANLGMAQASSPFSRHPADDIPRLTRATRKIPPKRSQEHPPGPLRTPNTTPEPRFPFLSPSVSTSSLASGEATPSSPSLTYSGRTGSTPPHTKTPSEQMGLYRYCPMREAMSRREIPALRIVAKRPSPDIIRSQLGVIEVCTREVDEAIEACAHEYTLSACSDSNADWEGIGPNTDAGDGSETDITSVEETTWDDHDNPVVRAAREAQAREWADTAERKELKLRRMATERRKLAREREKKASISGEGEVEGGAWDVQTVIPSKSVEVSKTKKEKK